MHAPQPLSRGVHRVGHPFGARTRCAAQCRAPTPSSARSGRTRGCARRMRCLRATTRGPRRRSAQGHAADAAAAREPARRRTRLPRRPSAPAAHSAPAQVIRAGALSSCAGRPHRQRTRLPAPDRPHRRPQLSARPPLPAASSRVSAGDAVDPHRDALQACGFARRIYGRLPCALPACIRDGYVRDARWQRT